VYYLEGIEFREGQHLTLLLVCSIAITLAATPWVSADALIVPKIIVLATAAGFMLPNLMKNYRQLLDTKSKRNILILSILFSVYMLLVMATSQAPLEQELFGQTGRGLGFITYSSLLILMLYALIKVNFDNLKLVLIGVFVSCLFSSIYSIMQYFGFDVFDWRTQTNGIIGTLGNPNFQSSFVAISIIPSIAFFWSKKNKVFTIPIVTLIFLFTLFICNSTQGYIATIFSSIYLCLTYLWFKRRKNLFFMASFISFVCTIFAVLGMLNKGPLSYYLYKTSIQSRGEMWQTTLNIIIDNPWTGIGIDSLGDFSLRYRDEKIANGIAEYIDNAHNFFLQFAATGGIPLSILYVGILAITFISIVRVQVNLGRFNLVFSALVSAWISFQLQSLISPAAIPTLAWNFIFCGALVGLNKNLSNYNEENQSKGKVISPPLVKSNNSFFSAVSAILVFILTIPLFHADKVAKQADTTRDGFLAVKAANTYPRSIVRYNRLGAGLFESGLYDLSLEIGRSAVAFNPNSYLTWVILMVNPKATLEERLRAKAELIKIDPFNLDVQNYPIE
jgi:O-antigen ligase